MNISPFDSGLVTGLFHPDIIGFSTTILNQAFSLVQASTFGSRIALLELYYSALLVYSHQRENASQKLCERRASTRIASTRPPSLAHSASMCSVCVRVCVSGETVNILELGITSFH